MWRPTTPSTPEKPFENRQLVHNLNRIWSDEWLEGAEDSPELRRARELRPVVAAADHILDLHSTSQDVVPFWVYPAFARNAAVALAIGRPSVHLVMPKGLGSGTPLIQHGRHGEDEGPAGAALVAECGQHFLQATADTGGGGDASISWLISAWSSARPTPRRPGRSGASSCWRRAWSRRRNSASCGRSSASRCSPRTS